MPINKETQTVISVTVDKEVAAAFKELAKLEKRSASAQAAILIEQYIKDKKK